MVTKDSFTCGMAVKTEDDEETGFTFHDFKFKKGRKVVLTGHAACTEDYVQLFCHYIFLPLAAEWLINKYPTAEITWEHDDPYDKNWWKK